MNRRLPAAFLVVAALAGCSSDKSTGPAAEGGPFEGTWAVSWNAVTGGGASCRLPSLTIAMHQFGDSVTGTYISHNDAACLLGDELFAGQLGVGQTGGHLAGDTVQFGFSLPLFALHAHAHDSILSGVLVWRVAFSETQTTYTVLSGNWTAHRVPPPSSGDAPADIQIYPNLPILVQSDSTQLTDTVRNADGQAIPGAVVTYSTSNSGTAVVTPGGMLQAKGEGLTLYSIIASSGGAYAEAVAVNIPGAARMTVAPASLTISRYRDVQLTVQVFDSLGESISYVTPAYSVSPAGVVTVTTAGRVTSAGTLGGTNVIVHAGAATVSVPVSVVSTPVSFQVGPASGSSIAAHDSLQLTAAVLDSVGLPVPGTAAVFTSTNPSVLSVSQSGLVRSEGPDGFADITATSGAYTKTWRFVVRSGSLPSVVATTHVAGTPFGVAVGPNSAVYVGTDDNVSGFDRGDLPSFDLSRHVSWPGIMKSMAFDSSGHRVFVGRLTYTHVGIIDVDSNRIIDSITVPAGAETDIQAVGVSPDGTKLFVGWPLGIEVFDAHSYAPLKTISAAGVLHFSFNHASTRAYATLGYGGVQEIDLSSLTAKRLWLSSGALGSIVSPDDSELYIADGNVGLRVVKLASGQEEPPDSLPGLVDVAVLPAADLIVGTGLDGNVYLIDRPSGVVVGKLPVGGIPRRMAVDPTGHTIVEANEAGWVDFIQ